MNDIRINIVAQHFMDGYGIYIFQKEQYKDGQVITVGEPIVMKPHESEIADPPPTAFVQESTLQMLFEQLWNLGFRPKDYGEKEGELKATKYHLKDMRTLVKGLD